MCFTFILYYRILYIYIYIYIYILFENFILKTVNIKWFKFIYLKK